MNSIMVVYYILQHYARWTNMPGTGLELEEKKEKPACQFSDDRTGRPNSEEKKRKRRHSDDNLKKEEGQKKKRRKQKNDEKL